MGHGNEQHESKFYEKVIPSLLNAMLVATKSLKSEDFSNLLGRSEFPPLKKKKKDISLVMLQELSHRPPFPSQN